MIPCVSLAETSVIGNMKERVKEMKVFGCRLNFWNHIGHSLTSSKAKEDDRQAHDDDADNDDDDDDDDDVA
ncbi:hypothetical protein AWZ03_009278 [Drosophila navojoa]|uniref:Uncharacterized protein n=1 Tax=Drosophila navojoa TaxID=7232 RepID=A0A484B942_DRONA|nr:hypothetical protein AWZ03_009278 [Drosophila navojoa]